MYSSFWFLDGNYLPPLSDPAANIFLGRMEVDSPALTVNMMSRCETMVSKHDNEEDNLMSSHDQVA